MSCPHAQYPDNETLVERPGVKRATSFSVQEAFSSSYSRSTHKNRRSSLSESPLVSISHELGKMTVSPLVVSSTVTDDAKRKTHTSSIEDLAQQSLSIRVSPPSPGGSMLCMVTSPMTIPRKERSYGFTLKTIRIYIGETSDYRMHHIIGVSEANCMYTLIIMKQNNKKLPCMITDIVQRNKLWSRQSLIIHH